MSDDADYDEDDDEGPELGTTIEIVGLSLYTHHGVTDAEREIGQRLVFDIRFDVGEVDALVTDRVEDTVDYGKVCEEIAQRSADRFGKADVGRDSIPKEGELGPLAGAVVELRGQKHIARGIAFLQAADRRHANDPAHA